MAYSTHVAKSKKLSTKPKAPVMTPQNKKARADQVMNEAGGYTFKVDFWAMVDRFLVLGTEGGSYYASEQKMTVDAAKAVLKAIKADGRRLVARVVEISRAGRAPKNDPALFALILATIHGDVDTRRAAWEALPKVARIGTHLLHAAQFRSDLAGWGNLATEGFSNWFTSMDPKKLAYQAIKYQQRDGWSLADVLRKAHPKAEGVRNDIFKWIVDGWESVGEEPHPDEALRVIWAFERAKRAKTVDEIVSLIVDHKLPREAIPTQHLNEVKVWAALLDSGMPIGAMIRNLGVMTKNGLLAPGAKATATVVGRLGDKEAIEKSRIHPVNILAALLTYKSGRSARGSSSWTPVGKVVDALDGAFYLAFGNVPSSGKRHLLGLDLSGSMHGTVVNGIDFLPAHMAQGAMAMITERAEETCTILGYDTAIHPLAITARQRLDDVMTTLRHTGGGGTDCALPIQYAMQHRVPVDVFVLFTDSQSWYGSTGHVFQVVEQYRQKMGIGAKLITVAMTANRHSVGDQTDPLTLDVAGFDTIAPQLISGFASDFTGGTAAEDDSEAA